METGRQRILCASSPAEAKQAGRAVSNFDRADWNAVIKGIMLDLLRIKFKDGSEVAKFLKATTGKSLAEAGKSKSFALLTTKRFRFRYFIYHKHVDFYIIHNSNNSYN